MESKDTIHGWQPTETAAAAVPAAPSPPRWRAALKRHPMVNLALLFATLVTTTWAGAAYQGVSLLDDPARWTVGLPYALAVLLILGVHEMGHYAAARLHGVRVSLPYFIPVPFALGTFGAFIRMEDGTPDRRKMFDIAVAGPLAGLVATLVVLAVAFATPSVGGGPAVAPSSSALLGLVAHAFGRDATAVAAHPLAFAGWLGLLLTAFNLLPVGQLDGGHMARALFGERPALWLGRVTLAAMLLLGVIVWHGFLLWALVAFALGGTGSAASDQDASGARGLLRDPGRQALALAAFALVAFILLPWPGASSSLAAAAASACPWA